MMIAALMTAEIACSLESNMIFVAMSRLYGVLGDPLQVGWLITAFSLASAAAAGIGGRLGDIFGRRRVLLILLVVGMSGSLLSAVGHTLPWVIVGRVMQGSTMAILPLCFGILRENLAPSEVRVSVNFLTATYSITAGLAGLLGGLIIDHFHWRGIFFTSALAAAISLVLVLIFVPRSPRQPSTERFDLWGAILFAPAIALILYGVAEIRTGGILGLPGLFIAAGSLLLFLWARHELKHPHPLISLRLLTNRKVLMANGIIFLAGVGPMMGSAALLPLFQQPLWTGAGFALTATLAGLIKVGASTGGSAAILIGGMIAHRLGNRMMLIVTSLWTVGIWFALAANIHDLRVVIILTLLSSAGPSLAFSLVPQIIIESSPPERTGEATGMSQVIRALGNTIGAQLVAMCLVSSVVQQPGQSGAYPAESAYILLYVLIGMTAVAATGLALALPKSMPTARPSQPDNRETVAS